MYLTSTLRPLPVEEWPCWRPIAEQIVQDLPVWVGRTLLGDLVAGDVEVTQTCLDHALRVLNVVARRSRNPFYQEALRLIGLALIVNETARQALCRTVVVQLEEECNGR